MVQDKPYSVNGPAAQSVCPTVTLIFKGRAFEEEIGHMEESV